MYSSAFKTNTHRRNSFKTPFYGPGIALACLLLFLTTSTPEARRASGKWYFEKAYRIEKKEPEKAIKLYRRALSLRLDAKLRKSARWQLFYLYKRTARFHHALRMAPYLGAPRRMAFILGQLHRDMRFRWKINKKALDEYIKGIQILYFIPPYNKRNKKNLDRDYMAHFNRAISHAPGNQKFRKEIAERLREAGKEDLAYNIYDYSEIPPNVKKLTRAGRLFKEGKLGQAEQILAAMARSGDNIKNFEKARILYLLGRIYRKRKQTTRAVSYFRLSASYAVEPAESNRQIALAAYSLYKGNLRRQAMALVRGLPPFEDDKIRLLILVIKADVDRDPKALRRLAEMKVMFRRKVKAGNASFLTRRALSILKARRPRP